MSSARPLRIRSHSIEVFFNTQDIILAKVAAGLNLGQLHVDLAGVGEPVRRANRQANLVTGQGLDLLETRGWADRASGVIEA